MIAFEEAAQRRRESPEPTADQKTTPPRSTAGTSGSVDDDEFDYRGRMGPVGSLVEHLKEQLGTASRTISRQVIPIPTRIASHSICVPPHPPAPYVCPHVSACVCVCVCVPVCLSARVCKEN